MSRKYVDDFVKLPVDKMAQSICDMTYSFSNTIVPKKHYKELLEKEIVELASQDINMEMALLKPYLDMITKMNKESRKYFIKALMMYEFKTKETANEVYALSMAYDYIEDNKLKHLLDSSIVELYEKVKKYGVENSNVENKDVN